MTLLVISDTHGREDRIRELLRLHREAEAVLFLGDGLRDLPEELCSSDRPRLFADFELGFPHFLTILSSSLSASW